MSFNLSIENSKNNLLYDELSNLLGVQSNIDNLLAVLKNIPLILKHHSDIEVVFDIKNVESQVYRINKFSEPICSVIFKMCK